MTLQVLYMLVLCFTTFCELHNETIGGGQSFPHQSDYDRHFQPVGVSKATSELAVNEAEGKKVRRILTNFFDP